MMAIIISTLQISKKGIERKEIMPGDKDLTHQRLEPSSFLLTPEHRSFPMVNFSLDMNKTQMNSRGRAHSEGLKIGKV